MSDRKKTALGLLIVLLLAMPMRDAGAQVRAGAAYLKMMPGTRQQNLAGSLTAGLDEAYSIYANPAATGFVRQWQLSLSHMKWIADLSTTSFLAAKQFRLQTPFGDRVHAAFTANYQGIDNFDATEGLAPSASASDALFGISLGLPISKLTRSLALGATMKYLRSDLAQHSASALVADVGVLYRSPRIPFDFLFADQLILSVGGAVTNMGQSMTFIDAATPLPRTYRAGLAVNLGKHDHLQVQLSGDYRKVRDEPRQFAVGAEILNLLSPWSASLGRALAIRGGWTFSPDLDDRLLSKFTLGFSFYLDDYQNERRLAQPELYLPRNSALRADAGFMNSTTFSSVMQGSVSLQPAGPEPFAFRAGPHHSFAPEVWPDSIYAPGQEVRLAWEATRDPDLYDDVNYAAFIIRGGSRAHLDWLVEKTRNFELDLLDSLNTANRREDTRIDVFHLSAGDGVNGDAGALHGAIRIADQPFDMVRQNQALSSDDSLQYTFAARDTGNYYWTVMAYDRNRHVRFAHRQTPVGHFRIGLPDLMITILPFDLKRLSHRQTSANDGEGFDCDVHLAVENIGEAPALPAGQDYFTGKLFKRELLTGSAPEFSLSQVGSERPLRALAPSERVVIPVRWDGSRDRDILAAVDEESRVADLDRSNNSTQGLLPFPDIHLTIARSKQHIRNGDSFEYTLTLRNEGETAYDIAIEDSIPDYVNATPLDTLALDKERSTDDVFVWVIDSLTAGDSLSIQVAATLANDLPDYVRKFVSRARVACACNLNWANNSVEDMFETEIYDLELHSSTQVEPLRLNIQFAVGKSLLKPTSEKRLDVIGKALKQPELKNAFVRLEGHTDSQGFASFNGIRDATVRADSNKAANQRLSESRVRSAAKYLKEEHSIAAERIIPIGYGQSRPLPHLPSTEDGRNRRVEILFLKEPLATPDSVDKRFVIDTIFQGDPIAYHLDIVNTGPDGASYIDLKRGLPDGRDAFGLRQRSGNGATRDQYAQMILYLEPGAIGIDYSVNTDTIPEAEIVFERVESSHLVAAYDSNPANNQRSDTVYVIRNTPPGAKDVRIDGVPEIGSRLTGRYTYYDDEADMEADSRFRWLRNNLAIAGASGRTYVVVGDDAGQRLTFEVTPAARPPGRRIGRPKHSDAVRVTSASVPTPMPVVTALQVEVRDNLGQKVRGKPQVGDALKVQPQLQPATPDIDLAANLVFRWQRRHPINDVNWTDITSNSGPELAISADLMGYQVRVVITAQTGAKIKVDGRSLQSTATGPVKYFGASRLN